MRILDCNDNELSTKDVDGRVGYLEVEKLFIQHHPQIDEQEEKSHYKVKRVQFTDGSFLDIEDNDPHIINIDAENGIFDFQLLPDETPKEVQSMDIELIIDCPHQDKVEAWDEYEYIERYKLFTEAELRERSLQEKKEKEREKFLETAPQLMREMQQQILELQQQIEQLNMRGD